MKAANEWQLGQQLLIAVSVMERQLHDNHSDWFLMLSTGSTCTIDFMRKLFSLDETSHRKHTLSDPNRKNPDRKWWQFLNSVSNYFFFVCGRVWERDREQESEKHRERETREEVNVTMWQCILVKCFPKYIPCAFHAHLDAAIMPHGPKSLPIICCQPATCYSYSKPCAHSPLACTPGQRGMTG